MKQTNLKLNAINIEIMHDPIFRVERTFDRAIFPFCASGEY